MAEPEEDTISQASQRTKIAEGDDEDVRLEFLLAYLTKTLRMKQEKWTKMMQAEENKVSLFYKSKNAFLQENICFCFCLTVQAFIVFVYIFLRQHLFKNNEYCKCLFYMRARLFTIFQ